ncbi:hypothetical protein, partial [Vibrio parahaemolyticus]|uniref:hypothetical protein n=2 Tax=Vibrionaceae TaxID=641 RepID=UPI0021520254
GTLDDKTNDKEACMLFRIIFTVLSCSALFIVISDNVANWMSVMAWIYIFAMMAVGVMTLKADKIITWCDKLLTKKDDKNAP